MQHALVLTGPVCRDAVPGVDGRDRRGEGLARGPRRLARRTTPGAGAARPRATRTAAQASILSALGGGGRRRDRGGRRDDPARSRGSACAASSTSGSAARSTSWGSSTDSSRALSEARAGGGAPRPPRTSVWPRASRATPRLAAALADEVSEVRLRAAKALGLVGGARGGPPARRRADRAEPLVDDPHRRHPDRHGQRGRRGADGRLSRI